MLIWKYDESNQDTHLSMIEVSDDHVLSGDELKELPADFLTPAKLVNGVLTSATQTESDTAVSDYRKDNSISTDPQPTMTQQSIAMLNLQIAKLSQQVSGLTSLVQAQQQKIAKSKGGN